MKKIKKYVTMALAGVMILSFAGCNMIEKTPEAIQKTVLAKVGDKKITKGDVDTALKAYLDQYKQQYGENFESKEELKEPLKNIRKQQLEAMVEQEVLLQNKENLGVSLSDEEIQTQVDERIKGFKEQFGSDEAFEQAIQQYGYTDESFEKFLKDQVVLEAASGKIVEGVEVSDDDVQKYYDDNKETYTKKAGADVTHLLFQPTKDSNGKPVEGADEQAKAKAEAAKAKAAAGTSLKDLSENAEFKAGDKFTSKFEDLGRVSFENSGMVKEFEEAFKKLPANQVSDVVKTDFGYHIIVNTAVYPNDEVTPLDDTLKEKIKSDVLQQKQKDTYDEKMKELKEKLKVKVYEDKL